jgi:effector-binding domain-containing protein
MRLVQSRSVAEQSVLSIRKPIRVKQLPHFIGDSIEALVAAIGSSGGARSGPPFVIYHGPVDEAADGPVEVCVPYDGNVSPTAGLEARIEPPHDEAFTTISKAEVEFPGILKAYGDVEAWLEAAQLEIAGAPREVYFADWDAIGSHDPACDVAFPVRAKP